MAEFMAYFNGEWVPNSQVMINPFDRGFTMGDVVFDVERTFNGTLFRLQEHLDRLYRSFKYARLDPGLTMHEMAEITEELVRCNEPMRPEGGDFTVRQIVTRGTPSAWTQGSITDTLRPTVINIVSVLDFSTYAHYYETGAAVVFPAVRSYSSSSLDPKVKHYSRANFVQAQLQVADIDPQAYPVLLDQNGNIAENVGANFFIVTDRVLRTPRDQSILQGISRMTAIEVAQQMGIPVVEEDLQPYDAYTADEAFLTTSSYQLLPVRTIDKRQIGDTVPGPLSQQLLEEWSELVGLDIVGQALRWAKRHG